MSDIYFIDTTIRDGQASLWAMNMRARHLAPVMPGIDEAGFDGVEFLAPGGKLKKFVRHLHENPWDWIKQGAAAAQHTELRWHGTIDGRTLSGFVPASVGELMLKIVADLGIRYTRTGNNWNNYDTLFPDLARYNDVGITPVINLIYSVSPKHTDEYFVAKAKEAARIAPYRLCFKDVGGLLTPDRVRELLPKILDATPGIEWEFHGHCNNGLGPLNALECAKLGIRYLHAAIPPLANGNSQPSIFSLVTNLRQLGFTPQIDVEPLRGASEHLSRIASENEFPVGVPYEYDASVYRHQIPGGMRSNLQFQLKQAGVEDRFDQVLEEAERVRAEFGYPIMVTPLSQIVGGQAGINVLTGGRYEQVSDEAIEYALGRHGGEEATHSMNADVRAKILDRPRARELEARQDKQPTLRELRQRYGVGTSDEDLILRTIVGDDAVEVAQSGATASDESISILSLLRSLSERSQGSSISLHTPALSVEMR